MMNKTSNGRSALLAVLLLCLSLFILTVPKAADASGIGNARVTASASSRQSSVIGKTSR